MKRFVIFLLMLTAMLSLTTVAHADAIAGPLDAVFTIVYLLRPMILVAVVVIVTILLLKKFRQKK